MIGQFYEAHIETPEGTTMSESIDHLFNTLFGGVNTCTRAALHDAIDTILSSSGNFNHNQIIAQNPCPANVQIENGLVSVWNVFEII